MLPIRIAVAGIGPAPVAALARNPNGLVVGLAPCAVPPRAVAAGP